MWGGDFGSASVEELALDLQQQPFSPGGTLTALHLKELEEQHAFIAETLLQYALAAKNDGAFVHVYAALDDIQQTCETVLLGNVKGPGGEVDPKDDDAEPSGVVTLDVGAIAKHMAEQVDEEVVDSLLQYAKAVEMNPDWSKEFWGKHFGTIASKAFADAVAPYDTADWSGVREKCMMFAEHDVQEGMWVRPDVQEAFVEYAVKPYQGKSDEENSGSSYCACCNGSFLWPQLNLIMHCPSCEFDLGALATEVACPVCKGSGVMLGAKMEDVECQLCEGKGSCAKS